MTKNERAQVISDKTVTIYETENLFVLKTARVALSKIKYIDFILFNVLQITATTVG